MRDYHETLRGKRAFVFGASGGIGSAIAAELVFMNGYRAILEPFIRTGADSLPERDE